MYRNQLSKPHRFQTKFHFPVITTLVIYTYILQRIMQDSHRIKKKKASVDAFFLLKPFKAAQIGNAAREAGYAL